MCYKAVVLEVKENYCIVMLDDSQIVRIKKKEGIREGQKIYVLEEDFYHKSSNSAAVIPFGDKKKKKVMRKSLMTKIAAAAAAFLVFAGAVSLPQITAPVYATVSFDGDQSVQLQLDKENRVLGADSYDHTVDESILKAMKGKNLDELWNILRKMSDPGESILVASAPMNKRAKDNEKLLEQYIHDNLENEEIICLRGDKNDVKGAEEAKKSLGIYILEKTMTDDDFSDHLGEIPYESGYIAGFLDRLKEKYPETYEKLMQMDDDFDLTEYETEPENEKSPEDTEIEAEDSENEEEEEPSDEEEAIREKKDK